MTVGLPEPLLCPTEARHMPHTRCDFWVRLLMKWRLRFLASDIPVPLHLTRPFGSREVFLLRARRLASTSGGRRDSRNSGDLSLVRWLVLLGLDTLKAMTKPSRGLLMCPCPNRPPYLWLTLGLVRWAASRAGIAIFLPVGSPLEPTRPLAT